MIPMALEIGTGLSPDERDAILYSRIVLAISAEKKGLPVPVRLINKLCLDLLVSQLIPMRIIDAPRR